MTPEELLLPRWKVIANFPESPYKIGYIIIYGYFRLNNSEYFRRDLMMYPALFKKLDWWEDRKVEDMPTHIKSIKSGQTFEVIDYSLDYNEVEYWGSTGEEQVSQLTNFIPA